MPGFPPPRGDLGAVRGVVPCRACRFWRARPYRRYLLEPRNGPVTPRAWCRDVGGPA